MVHCAGHNLLNTRHKSNVFLKLILVVIAATAIGFFLFTISDIVKLVIIAGLLAYILDPLANIMESRGMSRTSATVAIFTGIVLLSVLSYFVFLPLLSEEIKSLKSGFGPEQTGVMVSRLEEFLVTNLSFIGVRNLNIEGKLQGKLFEGILNSGSVTLKSDLARISGRRLQPGIYSLQIITNEQIFCKKLIIE